MSDHALHLGSAADDLRRRMERLGERGAGIFAPDEMKVDNWIHGLIQSACLASRKHREEREDALQEVGKRLGSNCNSAPIDTVYVHQDGSWCTADADTPKNICQFKQQYCVRNVPCLVRGLDQTHFVDVSAQWRSDYAYEGEQIGETSKINTEWFRWHVGGDTAVPVRVDSICKEEDGLDNEGRAQECETVQTKMSDWIVQCKHQSNPTGNDDANMQRRYLKDWHLVQYLSEKHPEGTPLYTTPAIFQRDILNSFLTRYGGGDWKFVYWGPAGSQTRLHSDVLHSFSWSYNVVGKKKWRFYLPPSCDETNSHTEDEIKSFEVIQHSGEAIFVPATWRHEVINLVETISINHNWITSANVDLAWRCLLVEMAAIETEVNEWGIPADDYGARENMLRGCVGLNVSMFALIILLEIAELLEMVSRAADKKEPIDGIDDTLWDHIYSLFRLETVLLEVMDTPCFVQRLKAMLESQALAVEECANNAIEYVARLKPITI